MTVFWSELSSRGASPKLWKGLALPNRGLGQSGNPTVGFFDDFTSFAGSTPVASNAGRYVSEGNNYLSYETSNTSIVNVALSAAPATTAPTSIGAIALTPTTTDNDMVALQWGGTSVSPYGCCPFTVVPGVSGDLVFEARFKVATVTASLGNFFLGLVGAAGVAPIGAQVPITQANALATTVSILGIGRLDSSTTLDLLYERASGTAASVSGLSTMSADTYIKAGFRWNAQERILIPYVNGEPVGPSKWLSRSVTGATPWPNDYMAPVMCVMEIGTTACVLTVDWWACAQYLL